MNTEIRSRDRGINALFFPHRTVSRFGRGHINAFSSASVFIRSSVVTLRLNDYLFAALLTPAKGRFFRLADISGTMLAVSRLPSKRSAMPQITIHLDEKNATGVAASAKRERLPVSKRVGRRVEHRYRHVWPEGYFERTYGCIKDPKFKRPPQGRLKLSPAAN